MIVDPPLDALHASKLGYRTIIPGEFSQWLTFAYLEDYDQAQMYREEFVAIDYNGTRWQYLVGQTFSWKRFERELRDRAKRHQAHRWWTEFSCPVDLRDLWQNQESESVKSVSSPNSSPIPLTPLRMALENR